MLISKCKILVVDRNEKYHFLFKGFRKNKYVISNLESISNLNFEELINYNLFFVIVYDIQDLLEVLHVYNVKKPIIIATEKVKNIKKIKKIKKIIKLNNLPVVDLTIKNNLFQQLHDALTQSLN